MGKDWRKRRFTLRWAMAMIYWPTSAWWLPEAPKPEPIACAETPGPSQTCCHLTTPKLCTIAYSSADAPSAVTLRADEQDFGVPICTLPAGTVLYHWGARARLEAWAEDGRLTDQEMDAYLNSSTGGYGIARGLYLSLSPLDSARFGEALLRLELAQDLHFICDTGQWEWAHLPTEHALMAKLKSLCKDESIAPLPLEHVDQQGKGPLVDVFDVNCAAATTPVWRTLLTRVGIDGINDYGLAYGEQTTSGQRWLVAYQSRALGSATLLSSEQIHALLTDPQPWEDLTADTEHNHAYKLETAIFFIARLLSLDARNASDLPNVLASSGDPILGWLGQLFLATSLEDFEQLHFSAQLLNFHPECAAKKSLSHFVCCMQSCIKSLANTVGEHKNVDMSLFDEAFGAALYYAYQNFSRPLVFVE